MGVILGIASVLGRGASVLGKTVPLLSWDINGHRGKNRAARVRERAKIPLGFSRADAHDSARVHGKQSHFQTEGWVQVRHLTGRCTSQELHLQRWGSRSCLHLCDSRELDLPHISSMRGHSRLPMCRAHWASGLLQLYHMLRGRKGAVVTLGWQAIFWET